MSVYNDVGSGICLASLAASKAIGVVIGFKHRNELPVPFYAQIVSRQSENVENQIGRQVQEKSLELMVPVQPAAWSGSSGFSGSYSLPTYAANSEGVLEGDRVEYPIGSSSLYYVRGLVQPSSNGYIWRFTGTKEQGTSLGQRS